MSFGLTRYTVTQTSVKLAVAVQHYIAEVSSAAIATAVSSSSYTASAVMLAVGTAKFLFKVSKGAKIRNRYNQVPHLTQDTKLIVDTTNESQEVSPFPAGDHKAHINRCAQRHSKHKTEQKH